MARIMNLGVWHKAYMLEIMGLQKEEGFSLSSALNFSGSEVFTFALPPEAEDFDYSQRVTETKTFGGAVFDDYGNDTFKITISGSTVNNEKKLIYLEEQQNHKIPEIPYLLDVFHEFCENRCDFITLFLSCCFTHNSNERFCARSSNENSAIAFKRFFNFSNFFLKTLV